MDTLTFFEKTTDRISSSLLLKVIGIAIIVLLLLIPASMVNSLILERQNRFVAAVDEIGGKWGGMQTLTGPILSIPYLEHAKKSDSTIVSYKRYAYFMPSDLQITGIINPVLRSRGIYKAVLYSADIQMAGSFANLDFVKLKIPQHNMLFDEAAIILGIPDLRGISKEITFKWNNSNSIAEPGIPAADLAKSGVTIPVKIQLNDINNQRFEAKLQLNGSKGLYFIPIGKNTKASLKSTWASPAFDGAFLPTERTMPLPAFLWVTPTYSV